jgi:hypothetical protein
MTTEFALSTESTISKLDAVRHQGMFPSAIVDMARTIGCDGLNLYSLHSEIYQQFASGSILPNLGKNFLSGEMSFRSERTFREVRTHSSPVTALQAYIAYPERVSSLDALVNLQDVNSDALVILYPYHAKAVENGEEWNKQWNEQEYPHASLLKHKLIRPEPGLLDRWGVSTTEEFIQESFKRGYNGFCLNAKHLIRLPEGGFRTKFEKYMCLVPMLLPHTQAIDLHPVIPSGKHFLLEHYLKSEEITLLNVAKRKDWKGLVILHFPFGQLKKVSQVSQTFLKELKSFLI